MRKGKLTLIAFLLISLALFLSGCGPTNQPPNAGYDANPTSGEAPLESTFDASGSSDPDGRIASYDWGFDDGSTGTGETVNHTFDSAGDYTVELTVTDDGGATNDTTKNISVTSSNQAPTASFSANPTSGEAPLEVTFDASSAEDSDGTITSYEWDFDDGSTGSGVSGTYTFTSSGTYNVQLTVTDNDGGTDSTSETISVSSEPNQPPSSSFTASPTSGEAPLEVSFDASGANDPDGSIDSYNWDFGDGTTGSGVTVNHTYDSSGSYTVQLTVTDDEGSNDTASETIDVSTASNQSPTAEFSYDPSSGYPPLEVTFDATDSSDPDGSIVSYSWDYDDGSGGSGAITTHTFYDSGVYDVTLTVYDDDGASSTKWYSVWVK
ncbi:PKD domain-containing protein [Candidatus Bipolaricaulota bacterium]|nr:PKD domain-containing protein [Candidatus Bipolaricaulota bacterium]